MVTKKQHYVPRSYLKYFAFNFDESLNNKQLKINIFDKKLDSSFVNSIYNIASENYFYDIAEIDNQILEEFFSNYIEGPFAKLNKKLEEFCSNPNNLFKKGIISEKNKKNFSILLVMQLIRTKRMKLHLKRMYKSASEKIKYFAEKYISIVEKNEKNKKLNINLDEEKLHFEYLADDDYVMELANFIFNSVWVFTYNLTNIPFITSDNPVSRVPRLEKNIFHILEKDKVKKEEKLELTGFMTEQLEINYPISPKVCLTIMRRKVPNFEKFKKYNNSVIPIFESNHVMQNNIMQFLMCNRQVFIPEEKDNIIKELKKIDISNFNGPIL